MLKINDAIRAACLARLNHAKKYDGLHEVNDQDVLKPLIAKAPGGEKLNLAKDGWCAHAVGPIDAELGYAPYGGRAANIAHFHVEISEAIPGCTVAMNGHAAFQDENPDCIYGGNQSQKFCSQDKKFYGEPIGYFVPQEMAALVGFPDETPAEDAEGDDIRRSELTIGADIKGAVAETKEGVSEVAAAIDGFVSDQTARFDQLDDRLDKLDKRLARIEDYLSQFSADHD